MPAESFPGRRVLITGGLGFIGSNLARRLVELGAHVLLVDSLVPEHGGLMLNIADILHGVTVELADARDEQRMGQRNGGYRQERRPIGGGQVAQDRCQQPSELGNGACRSFHQVRVPGWAPAPEISWPTIGESSRDEIEPLAS